MIAAYFAATLGLGWRVSRRHRGTEGYFLGGRSFPGWAIGLSLIGTMISSVTFLAYPADAFKTAWLRFAPNFAFPLVVLFTGWLFVPFFRRSGLTSAYEYLNRRFGPSVSAYAAVVFLLSQVARTATVLYLLSVLLAALTAWSVTSCLVFAGAVTAAYTVKGGFAAVVWTDVVQTLILIGGGLACVATICAAVPAGLPGVVALAWHAHKLSFLDLDTATGRLAPVGRGFSLTEPTVTMLIAAGVLQFLTGKVDQTTVQRWCAARSVREARKSMVVLGVAGVPIWGLFMFMGTALWVYYRQHPDPFAAAILAGRRKPEAILPHYILTALPPGLAGLVVAAALCASMGSLSSAINASAMVWVHDLYRPFLRPGRADAHYLRTGRIASVAVSAAMIAGGWLLLRCNAKTLNDIGFIVVQVLGGGLCGVFLLGMFTRVGDARAVGLGIAAAVAATLYILLGDAGVVPRICDSYYTSLVANALVVVVSGLAAGLRGPPRRDLTGLTLWPSRSPADEPGSRRCSSGARPQTLLKTR